MNYEWVPEEEFLEDVCLMGSIQNASEKRLKKELAKAEKERNKRGERTNKEIKKKEEKEIRKKFNVEKRKKKFKDHVYRAIRLFLISKTEPKDQEQNKAIKLLEKTSKAALCDLENEAKIKAVISKINALPKRAKEWVEEGYQSFPAERDLLDLGTRERSLERVHGMTSSGYLWAPGRNRSGGRQSRDFLEIQLKKFNQGKGQPKKNAERALILGLMGAYEIATGKKAFRRQNNKKIGPFMKLVIFIFEEISKKTGLKIGNPDHAFRTILEENKEYYETEKELLKASKTQEKNLKA